MTASARLRLAVAVPARNEAGNLPVLLERLAAVAGGLAADLSVKINEVRRILNVLDTYGVARYDTNKDNKGWLTFKWYLDSEKLGELSQSIENSRSENGYKLQDGCNDFFFCFRGIYLCSNSFSFCFRTASIRLASSWATNP
jgi:hypothetical protein